MQNVHVSDNFKVMMSSAWAQPGRNPKGWCNVHREGFSEEIHGK